MPSLADLSDRLRARRPAAGPYVIAVTGSVAAGKSAFSAALAAAVRAWPEAPAVEVVCTDGFLLDNAALEARGLSLRKGFPESYDLVALRAALAAIRRGPTRFPGYSHVTYDVDPALARTLGPPDVLIVEGLGLHLDHGLGQDGRPLIDVLIYLDAAPADLEAWFTARLLGLLAAAADDPTSFYAPFAGLDEGAARAFAAGVWTRINLPNLTDHIAGARERADFVVLKAADHSIAAISPRQPLARRRRMSRIVRIGGAGGFLGDSQTAAPQLLASGQVDYLVLDYLAEVTMSLLARSQAKVPEGGYPRDFTEWVWKDNLRALKAKGVKLVTNAGGLNPAACRARMQALAAEAGVSFKIAIVHGDDLRGRVGELAGEAREMFSGAPMPAAGDILSANAYFGAAPIARALAAGADVVITGRVVDSALALGPLMHEFGWAPDDYDRLAAGSLVGHVLECGAQCTGGLFTDWERVPDWAHIGYPIAECRADGSFVVTKPAGSGGLCTPATVAEQILYEIDDPQNYRLPDVTCDFTGVTVEAVGEDRVLVSGTKGRSPSGAYKVCLTHQDGWRCIVVSPVVGRDAAAKAERQADAVIERVEELLRARNMPPFRAKRVEALGAEATYGAHSRARGVREVVCKIAVEHDDPRAFDVFLREVESPTTSMSVGSTGWFGARPAVAPVVRIFSFLLDRARAVPQLDVGGEVVEVAEAPAAPAPAPPRLAPGETASPEGEMARPLLIDLAWARSGDKGDAFNIGVIARRPEYIPYIRAALTEAAVMAFFAHEFEGARRPSVTRYELPGLGALNFHLKESLGGGQMATLRLDALAKGKGQQLLDMEIPVPAALLKAMRGQPETVGGA